MTLTIDLPDEQRATLAAKARAQGLSAEEYARQVLQHDLSPAVFEQGLGLLGAQVHSGQMPSQPFGKPDESVAAATRRMATFRKRHGLSLGGLTVKELLHESRP